MDSSGEINLNSFDIVKHGGYYELLYKDNKFFLSNKAYNINLNRDDITWTEVVGIICKALGGSCDENSTVTYSAPDTKLTLQGFNEIKCDPSDNNLILSYINNEESQDDDADQYTQYTIEGKEKPTIDDLVNAYCFCFG